MTNTKKLKDAKKVYETMLALLKAKRIDFIKREEKLCVNYTTVIDGLSVDFYLEVEAERELISLYAKLPVVYGSERRVNGALATCQINYCLYDGSFDYSLDKGEVYFRATASFRSSAVLKDLFESMLNNARETITAYARKLLAFAEAKITIEECTSKN